MILRGPRVHCHFPAGTPSLRPPRAHRTVLRRGEALALRWPDVDLERGRSGSGEPCSSTAACSSPSPRRRSRSGSCRSPYRPSGSCATYATPGPGAPGRRLVLAGERPRVHHRVRRTLRPAQRPAGPRGSGHQGRAPDVGLHPLRHSAASVMLTHGVPLRVASEILGHPSVAITGRLRARGARHNRSVPKASGARSAARPRTAAHSVPGLTCKGNGSLLSGDVGR
jgi:integrase